MSRAWLAGPVDGPTRRIHAVPASGDRRRPAGPAQPTAARRALRVVQLAALATFGAVVGSAAGVVVLYGAALLLTGASR